MVKLSQQFLQDQEKETRKTRTERVAEQQAIEKQKKQYQEEKEKFERLKKEAEELQQTEFSDLKSIEEYKEKYRGLSADLKQFFQTPEQIQATKSERIEETKRKVDEEFERVNEQERKLQQEKRKLQSDNDTTRQDWNDWEEKQKYWEGYKRGLQEGKKQLYQGKDFDFNTLKRYASQIGDYEERRKRASNEGREFEYQQRQKIENLEQQGYKPFVVEEFEKQKPTKATLLYYNPEKKDFKKIKEFKAKPSVNVAGLEKIGYSTPQERKIIYGGKEISFKTRVPIYKEKSGEIVTPYGKTGLTENELIKQAQDKQYTEWKKSQPAIYLSPSNKPVFLEKGKDIPFDYGGQQTISDQPQYVLMSAEDYYLQEDQKSKISVITDPLKKLWEKATKYHWYYNLPSSSIYSIGYTFNQGLSVVPSKKGVSIDLTQQIDKLTSKMGDVSADLEKWAIGEKKIKEFESDIEQKYQGKYQQVFEQKYMKSLIYGDLTFEEASKEFQESADAKILQKQYEEEYKKGFKELSVSTPQTKKLLAGSGISAISFGELGLKAIRTPASTVVTAGAVYTGVKAIKLIPPAISYTASGGLFAYGSYKALSPTSTIEEAGSGLLTALISGATLGYGAYRYLRQPVIKTRAVKPKISAKQGKIVGFEQPRVVKTDIYGKTEVIEKTVYPKTISRQIFEGRRTIITTKGRELLRKYLGIKLDPLYKGFPSQQLGKTYSLQSLRGTYTYSTPSGYQKALNRLIKYGYDPSQVRSVLRYYSPRVIETEISGVNVLTYGDNIQPIAKARTTVITRQPKIDIGGGLKTRGAKTIKDVYQSEKQIVGTVKDYSLIRESSLKTTGFLTDKGAWYNKLTQAGKTTTTYEKGIIAQASDIKTGVLPKEITKSYFAGHEIKYQNLKEYFAQRQIIPKKYSTQFGEGSARLIKTDQIIYIDERELYGISAKKVTVPKSSPKPTPVGEITDEQLKKLIKDLQKVYGTEKTSKAVKWPTYSKPTSSVQEVANKLDDLKTPSAETSKYWGTGQYERSVGGLSPQDVHQSQIQQIKGIDLPATKLPKIKDIIKIKQLSDVGSKIGTLGAFSSTTKLKTQLKLKSDLKAKQNFKALMKEDVVMKQKQVSALKQDAKLKSQLRSLLDLKSPSITTTPLPPTYRPPPPKTNTPPIPKPIVIPYLKGMIKGRIKKSKKAKYDFAYLPDFTARALGLKAETLSEKQAQKKLKKLLTGLEIRRGVVLK